MKLRDYQRDAIDAVRKYLVDGREKGLRRPVVEVPTGGGKSLILAELVRCARKRGTRVLMLTHRKELIEQNRAAFVAVAPDLVRDVGVYSASLGMKRLDYPVTFAGIQSLARAEQVPIQIGLTIVDECHLVPETRGTQYGRVLTQLMRRNPQMVIVGLSATPFRTGEGYLWEAPEAERWFDGCAYRVTMGELVKNGYLAPLREFAPKEKLDTTDLKVQGGEFKTAEMEELTMPVVDEIAESILEHSAGREAIMVFTPSKATTHAFAAALRDRGTSCVSVLGDHDMRAREEALDTFKSGGARAIVSCGVLTTGFDAPRVDTIAVVRSTTSPGLWAQVCGRGSRLSPGKTDCLILDYGGNTERHGPVDEVEPVRWRKGKDTAPKGKECKQCHALNAARRVECRECGAPFPKREIVHKVTLSPSKDKVMSDEGWNEVRDAEAYLSVSKAGRRMVVVDITLKKRNKLAKAYFVIPAPVQGDPRRTFHGRKWKKCYDTPIPSDPNRALEIARKRLPYLKEIQLGDGGMSRHDVIAFGWSSQLRKPPTRSELEERLRALNAKLEPYRTSGVLKGVRPKDEEYDRILKEHEETRRLYREAA